MPPDAPTREHRYRTRAGVGIARHTARVPLAPVDPVATLAARLDDRRGVLLASSYEYPGRYTRWDFGFVDPPLELVAWGREGAARALNRRGEVLLQFLHDLIAAEPHVAQVERDPDAVRFRVREPTAGFTEEDRSRQPTVFSVLRAIVAAFGAADDPHLGLHGAFGYDLAFQFDPIRLRHPRPAGAEGGARDLVLYLPDAILVVDHQAEVAEEHRFEFTLEGGETTAGLPRDEGDGAKWRPREAPDAETLAQAAAGETGDHRPGEYADCVRVAHEFFRRGDLFEVVPGQAFFAPCADPPSELFRRLRARNPAPYGALMNLGEGEYLVAASPEMYVRVDGRRIETCPISGTVARGADAIGDAAQILKLLSSEKETSELTMCTDVDRNDKSRVCEPGRVRVIGRRQIEMYSRVIHTVDHVEGWLRDDFDALDGFLAHAWAVTVTGAPKHAAMQFIEDREKSVRRWYGGAIGMIGFDGNMNTGLTLRTIQIRDGLAEVRAGATLLVDSDPEEEERETRLKASALLNALTQPDPPPAADAERSAAAARRPGAGRKVLMVDHQDSFVHTLAAYFRETGAEVVTLRSGFDPARMDEITPDLVVLSPGPGTPADFGLERTIQAALARGLPLFGVCLGLQGIVEYFGGRLDTLGHPMHGRASSVRWRGGRFIQGVPERFEAGRYHSLFAARDSFPECLAITADIGDESGDGDGVVMALEHRSLPIAAVQFHPESILTLAGEVGRHIVHEVVTRLLNPGVGVASEEEAARPATSAGAD